MGSLVFGGRVWFCFFFLARGRRRVETACCSHLSTQAQRQGSSGLAGHKPTPKPSPKPFGSCLEVFGSRGTGPILACQRHGSHHPPPFPPSTASSIWVAKPDRVMLPLLPSLPPSQAPTHPSLFPRFGSRPLTAPRTVVFALSLSFPGRDRCSTPYQTKSLPLQRPSRWDNYPPIPTLPGHTRTLNGRRDRKRVGVRWAMTIAPRDLSSKHGRDWPPECLML